MEHKKQSFKIIIVGEPGVGKTSILERYCDKYFSDTYASTIGVDFNIKNVMLNGKYTKLQIWDTAGQERFRTITTFYYRGTDAVIITFDLTKIATFNKLSEWLIELKNYVLHNNFILVGNKSDDADREVDSELIMKFAKDNDLHYIETSAKKNVNIDLIFTTIVSIIINQEATIEKLSNDYVINEDITVEDNVVIDNENCC